MPPAIAAREPKRSTATPAASERQPRAEERRREHRAERGQAEAELVRSSGPIAGSPKLTNETATWAADAAVSTVRGERVCTAADYRSAVDREADRAQPAPQAGRGGARGRARREAGARRAAGGGRRRARRRAGRRSWSSRGWSPRTWRSCARSLDAPVVRSTRRTTPVEPDADEGASATRRPRRRPRRDRPAPERDRGLAAAAARVPALPRRPRLLTGHHRPRLERTPRPRPSGDYEQSTRGFQA